MKETPPVVKPWVLLAMELAAAVFVLMVLASVLNIADRIKDTERQALNTP
ncbi:MAG: hypothetical protein PHV74_07550 [Dehalococcoidia bacterium]|nr:hypothetical protein [Dehalococcoidia bacterium]